MKNNYQIVLSPSGMLCLYSEEHEGFIYQDEKIAEVMGHLASLASMEDQRANDYLEMIDLDGFPAYPKSKISFWQVIDKMEGNGDDVEEYFTVGEAIYAKEDLAKYLMKQIQYGAGVVDRWHPEKYPEEYINKISQPAFDFFACHNQLIWNEEDIANITDGDEDENIELYSKLVGWTELNEALNDYFNEGL